jgi:uncharacterized membrane protein YphA (DoxX/SURF4 family)
MKLFGTKISKYELLTRVVLFAIYFWFGALKVFGVSPANDLISKLLAQTAPFIDPNFFIIALGLFEMGLAVMFLIPRITRVTKILFFVHIITTFLPLFLLPSVTWSGLGSLTLEGQYIVKNLALILLVLGLREPERQ